MTLQASMGLELNLRETLTSLRRARLEQGQRSAMALAMATRNASGMFAVLTAFPNQDPRMLVMILLAGPVPALLALPLAKVFASHAGTTDGGGAA